mmetsp:Transcript_16842/g.27301  ORF Transcript_16842/g.27301 Transcript_16842/m.27301 type:complete len:125 (+) Transcript_16842:360-734(+)
MVPYTCQNSSFIPAAQITVTLEGVKNGFEFGGSTSWFSSNNCEPYYHGDSEYRYCSFACCKAQDENGKACDIPVFNLASVQEAWPMRGNFGARFGPFDEFVPLGNRCGMPTGSSLGCMNEKKKD